MTAPATSVAIKPEPKKGSGRSRAIGQIYGVKFRRQLPIGEFIANFACPEARLVIELDGAQHFEQVAKG
jgi:very-short-patch-repair endonuclease